MSEHEQSVPLRDHFESRIQALEKATILAAAQMERRLEGMNEFRETLREQAAAFVTRDELTVIRQAIDADLRVLRESRAELAGKANASSVAVSLIMAGFGLLVAIVGIILKL